MGMNISNSISITLEFFIWYLERCQVTCYVVDSLFQVWRTFVHGCWYFRLWDNGTIYFLEKAIKITKKVPLYIWLYISTWSHSMICNRHTKNCLLNNFSVQRLVFLQKNFNWQKYIRNWCFDSIKFFVKKLNVAQKNCSI